MMKYGYFDDTKKEYIITDPRTPVKWINYIGTLNFGGFVDHTGGMLLCKGDPAENRITKYIPQMPSSDMKGSTVYIRIKKDGKYKIYSPFFTPTLDNYDFFECRVGLQYTRFISEFYGIRTEITIFIPLNATCVVQDVKITNASNEQLEVDLIPVIEYTHFLALKQFNNADWIPQTMQSKLFEDTNGMKILSQFAFMHKDNKVNYLTSNYPVSSFESDRKVFLGANEYSSWANPLSLQEHELNNTQVNRGDNIGALLHHVGKLNPNDTKRIITLLGQGESVKDELKQINFYRNEENVDKALEEIKTFWDGYLTKMQVETPEATMNTMLNIHNPRQCYITKNWSRYLSLYQLGLGARGLGFRDSSQDVLGILFSKPEEGKELIKKLLHVQKCNGSAMHQFNPLSMVANEGDSREEEDRPKYYGDDHLWIILGICEYVKETGNIDFLEELIPFYDKDKNDKPVESGTVLEHAYRAVEFTHSNVGQHNIPLLGFADWNDTVNLRSGAESFFIANLYGVALKELISLMEYLNYADKADKFKGYYDDMKKHVNDCGWDGEWYIRYFDHDGSKIGTSENREGQIYCNGQSWPVMSGFATEDRAKKALDSVNKILNTKNGIKLSYPGFDRYDPDKGGITTYPPGAKENGGIFLHSNPWIIIAETLVGNGDRAFQYYNQINPAAKNDKIDEYECEPYCYAQNILGDEHPQFGLGRNSWLSGTSSWVYQASMKYIIGVRPTYNGLIIDPCIPKKWNGLKIKREFRNATYEIEINNPKNVSKGVSAVSVDGAKIDGNILPVFNDSKTHKVIVTMG